MKRYRCISWIVFFIATGLMAQPETLTPEMAQKKAINILESEGIQPALSFLKDYLNYSDDDKTVFLIAWTEYTNNNLAAAEQLAQYCVEVANSEEILASAYHLIGNIKKLNDLDHAMGYLEKGLRVFEIIRHHKGIYRSYLSMSQVALKKDETELANKYHVLALRIAIENDLDMLLYHLVGHFLNLAIAEHAVAKQHLLDVIELASQREKTFQVVEAKMHLVTIEYLMGNYQTADTVNQELIRYFEKHDDQIRKSFTLLNQFFINKCHKQAASPKLTEADIQAIISNQRAPKYYKQIYHLLRDTGCQ